MAMNVNGLMSPPQTEKSMSTTATPPRIILGDKNARILCVADIRGDFHELNRMIREHNATAVIHTGDFGFLTADSLERMGDKILRHLLQYSPLIAGGTRSQLLNIPQSAGRQALITALENTSIHFPLSQFPHLLSGAITFPVPVFTVWGLIEDVRVMEKFRTGEYEVKNLNVIDEASSRLIEVGGLKLRLFGLGGAVAMHKLFDHGEGRASIAGGQGTMWATALQLGELVDNAERTYDASETRLFIASAPIARWGLLEQTALAIKADLTISAGLHFRYPASFNAYSVHGDFEQYQQKFTIAVQEYEEVYGKVKDRFDAAMTASQMRLLKKASQVCHVIPERPDEAGWTSSWHWVLTDANTGTMLLAISEGRVSSETKSQGLHFGHRNSALPAPPNASQGNTSTMMQPRRVEPPASAPLPKPAANPARPMAQAPTKILAKPTPAAPAPAASAADKTVPTKPAQPPQGPKATQAPNNANNQAPPSSIPPKPMAQPSRQPRGPGSASQTPAPPPPPANKVENKPAPASAAAKAAQVPKAPTPVGNRKSPAPGPKGDKAPPKMSTTESTDKKVEAAPAKTEKIEKKEGEAGDKADEPATPTGPQQARNSEKRSLYLKKIPVPTSEEEIKALFPAQKGKITYVKIPYDHLKRQHKEFAYIDFATEEDAQDALKNHEEKIRDTTVTVVLSNPPGRVGSSDFGGRGRGGHPRGSMRGGRGGSRFGSTGGPRNESATGDKPAAGSADKKAAPATAPAPASAPVAAKKD